MESHNNQKKIALINDLSGFGKCSITVELPIISAMGVQCCPMPTSIFSNHTGYESFFFEDYTDKMEPYFKEWKKLDLQFEGICTGFLASERQIEIVETFLKQFKTEKTIVVVDPVMGDYGEIYPGYDKKTCEKMKRLIPYADIMTPNLTEACILTDTPYQEKWTRKEILSLAEKLSNLGPDKIVITGIVQGKYIANLCYEKGKEAKLLRCEKVGTQRAGTGDIFCSIVAADAVNGVSFEESVKKASTFLKKCIARTTELLIPEQDGVCFEEFLYQLRPKERKGNS